MWVTEFIIFQNDIDKKVEIYSKFVKIAQKLLQLKNYDGVMAIMFGFQSTPISRLKKIKPLLSQQILDIYHNIEHIFSDKNHYENLRNLQALNSSTCIPSIAFAFYSISYLYETQPFKDVVYSWTCLKNIYQCIYHIMSCHTDEYELQSDPKLHTKIKTFIELKHIPISKAFEWSLCEEPREVSKKINNNQLRKKLLDEIHAPKRN
eukprot:gene6167-10174_t